MTGIDAEKRWLMPPGRKKGTTHDKWRKKREKRWSRRRRRRWRRRRRRRRVSKEGEKAC